MKIIWTNQNYEIERNFGSSLCGVHHGRERPDKIIVSLKELPGEYRFIEQIKAYIRKELIPALANGAKREIILIS